MSPMLHYWDYAVVVYFFTLNAISLLMIFSAFFSVRKDLRLSRVFEDRQFFHHAALAAPISILVPAYNEERTVVENIYSLLSLNYPDFEVIVINDGSRDETLARMVERFGLTAAPRANPNQLPTQPVRAVYRSRDYPNLLVVDKANGGKADALNAGLNVSRNPLVAAIDTDSILERDVLLKLSRPFLENPEMVAVGGAVRVVNGCGVSQGQVVRVGVPRNWLARMQVIEYLRAFLFGRAGWGGLDMLMIISGAFGLFRKQAVVDVGGFMRDTVGEDMELVVRMHRRFREQRRPYRIQFIPEAVCWTEVPESVRQLGRQRDRWQRGLLDSLFTHRRMLFNPGYGRIGLVGMPYYLLFEGLGPLMEVAGGFSVVISALLGRIGVHYGVAFLATSLLLGTAASLAALVLEEISFARYPSLRTTLLLVGMGMAENFGYRQINSIWRLVGIVNYLRGSRAWGEIARKGFQT